MRNRNHVELLGHVGRDPETRQTNAGDAFTTFPVATTMRWKNGEGEDREETEWHQVTAYRSLAELVDRHVRKGDPVFVEGRIRSRTWTDGDGGERRTVGIVASEVIFLGQPEAA